MENELEYSEKERANAIAQEHERQHKRAERRARRRIDEKIEQAYEEEERGEKTQIIYVDDSFGARCFRNSPSGIFGGHQTEYIIVDDDSDEHIHTRSCYNNGCSLLGLGVGLLGIGLGAGLLGAGLGRMRL